MTASTLLAPIHTGNIRSHAFSFPVTGYWFNFFFVFVHFAANLTLELDDIYKVAPNELMVRMAP